MVVWGVVIYTLIKVSLSKVFLEVTLIYIITLFVYSYVNVFALEVLLGSKKPLNKETDEL